MMSGKAKHLNESQRLEVFCELSDKYFHLVWLRVLSHCAGKISQPGPYANVSSTAI